MGLADTERVFRRLCERAGRRFHQGGYETFDAVYCVLSRDPGLTNSEVAAELRRLDRPHSRRAIIYTRRRLEASGMLGESS